MNKKILILFVIIILLSSIYAVMSFGLLDPETTSETETFYFNSYTNNYGWDTAHQMTDGTTNLFSTSYKDSPAYITLSENTCNGDDLGDITRVEIRFHGGDLDTGYGSYITLQPIMSGIEGDTYFFEEYTGHEVWIWFDYVDITDQKTGWSWSDIRDLDVVVKGYSDQTQVDMITVGLVEVRVTYEKIVG